MCSHFSLICIVAHINLFSWFNLQANTHVNVHQDLKDVKLWQVVIFLCFLFVLICSLFYFILSKIILLFLACCVRFILF